MRDVFYIPSSVESDTDREKAFFNTGEFAITATIDGTPNISVIMTEPTIAQVFGVVENESNDPVLTCDTTDLIDVNIDDTVIVAGNSYKITAFEHTGDGISNLLLRAL